MNKIILSLLLGLLPIVSHAEQGLKLDHVRIDLSDQASLQRGARIFVNYCLSCHNAAYLRYNRMGHDLGISNQLVKQDLLFATNKIGDRMRAAMPAADAKKWFGVAPPDLTLEARYRGPDWIYTYMHSFYRDPKSFSGWNNTVFPHVAMPFVLYGWQGEQRAVFRNVKLVSHVMENGKAVTEVTEERVFSHFVLAKPGTMTPKQYDLAIRDLTNFMVYMGEPAKLERIRIGVYVLIFLAVFLVLAILLKKEYWKDVH